jgi:hypothetical protein
MCHIISFYFSYNLSIIFFLGTFNIKGHFFKTFILQVHINQIHLKPALTKAGNVDFFFFFFFFFVLSGNVDRNIFCSIK